MSLNVIVPLDSSEAAEQAIPYGIELAKRNDGPIVLLSSVEVTAEFDAWIETAAFALEDELDSWIAERREYLDRVAARIADVDVQTVVRVGRPADEIHGYAEEIGNAVIVMASHGRGGVQQLVMGSVAFQVIHDARTPVMVIRMSDETPAPNFDCVIVPLDGSRFSEQIIDQGLRIIAGPKPKVHLVRVMEAPTWTQRSINQGLVAEYLRATREEAELHMEEVAERLNLEEFNTTWEIRHGTPSQEILKAAREQNAGLVVMATHGRSGLGRLLIGSTAQKTLHDARIPLLLIHPTEEG